ncbi:Conserved oligomeric Golgi complex subunit, partial [Rhizophlyctis rosea]
YKDFLEEAFEPSEYANVILQAPVGSAFHGMDVQTALAKLSFGIDHLNKQVQEQVTTHYEELLHQVTGLSHLEGVLGTVRQKIEALNASFDRVRSKIRDPYSEIQAKTTELERIQAASEVLRRVIRFLYLVKRLETQLPGGERELAKAALSVNELDSIIKDADLNGINVVDVELESIAAARKQITAGAQALLERGMTSQNQTEVAAALQVFHNLGQMAEQAQDVIEKMLEQIAEEMRHAFDFASLNREAMASARKTGDQPSKAAIASAFNSVLWTRMEQLMDVIYERAAKVYLMERVLSRKRDPLTHVSFLDEVAKNMDGNIITFFWQVLSSSFDRELRLATKSSASQLLQQVFQVSYPKLLRLFHDFFSRVAVISGSVFSRESHSPESTFLLKTLAPFEAAYLSKSLTRLMEFVNAAFPSKPVPGSVFVPQRDDVDKIARSISGELDLVKFDATLLVSVGKNVTKAIKLYAVKCESLSATDPYAYQVSGVGTATQSQLLNIEIVNCLWWLQESVWRTLEEYGESAVVDVIGEALDTLANLIQGVVEPLLNEVTRELEGTILKMHHGDDTGRYQRPAGRGGSPPRPSSSTSPYVVELASKIRWVQREILSRFQCGEESKDWIRTVGARIIDFFLRHASIVRPLSEPVKMRLAGDMTQLEFTLNQWFTAGHMRLETDVRQSYRALRAFKPLLFLDLNQIASSATTTSSLPPLVILHHLFSRVYPQIQLPTIIFGWTEAQYSEWLDTHEESDALDLLERCLDVYVEDVSKKGEKEFCPEYPVIRELITELRGSGVVGDDGGMEGEGNGVA